MSTSALVSVNGEQPLIRVAMIDNNVWLAIGDEPKNVGWTLINTVACHSYTFLSYISENGDAGFRIRPDT